MKIKTICTLLSTLLFFNCSNNKLIQPKSIFFQKNYRKVPNGNVYINKYSYVRLVKEYIMYPTGKINYFNSGVKEDENYAITKVKEFGTIVPDSIFCYSWIPEDLPEKFIGITTNCVDEDHAIKNLDKINKANADGILLIIRNSGWVKRHTPTPWLDTLVLKASEPYKKLD